MTHNIVALTYKKSEMLFLFPESVTGWWRYYSNLSKTFDTSTVGWNMNFEDITRCHLGPNVSLTVARV